MATKPVYDIKYIADGTEGSTLTLAELAGKKILEITREQAIMYKVASNPDSAEFTWNDLNIVFGASINPGERILILYRMY